MKLPSTLHATQWTAGTTMLRPFSCTSVLSLHTVAQISQYVAEHIHACPSRDTNADTLDYTDEFSNCNASFISLMLFLQVVFSIVLVLLLLLWQHVSNLVWLMSILRCLKTIPGLSLVQIVSHYSLVLFMSRFPEFFLSGCETAEIAWVGKGNEKKRGQPIENDAPDKNWLYLNGWPVKCNRHMEVAAIVTSMNPGIDSKTDSKQLGCLQQVRNLIVIPWNLLLMYYYSKPFLNARHCYGCVSKRITFIGLTVTLSVGLISMLAKQSLIDIQWP